jgi:hypothetical protein
MFTAHTAEFEHPALARIYNSAQYAAFPKKRPFRPLTRRVIDSRGAVVAVLKRLA